MSELDDPLAEFRRALLADPGIREHRADVYRAELEVRERIGGAQYYVRKPERPQRGRVKE